MPGSSDIAGCFAQCHQADCKRGGVAMFGKSIVCNVIESSEREFLATNGLGGFASMSLNGGPSRKYHALLVAALSPPLGRHVVLHNIEETLEGVSFVITSYSIHYTKLYE